MKLALSLLRRRVSPFACKPWNEASFASFHSMSADPTFLSSTINAVVKIFTSSRNSDFLHPWGSPISGPSSGSGFIIPGRRIITNAHVVTGAIFIRAKKHKSGIMYKAHVQAFGHDCDLAILTIEDDDFWNDVKPLTLLKDLPKLSQILHIVGYPEGGDNICITRGIVSRIDVSVYSHSKGNVQLPTIQLDAAINSGNSGGPVFVDNMVVGVAFQSLVGDNIGYVIPAPIVNLFMTSIEAGKSSVGFCSLDICLQAMDNLTMRDYFQMTKKMSGILVTDVGVSSSDFLEKYDIILEVDGIPVQDDGEVFVNDVGLQLNGYIALKNPREEVSLKVLRKATVINISLNATVGYISSTEDYQIPGYLQYGGFVFTTAYGAVFISQVVEEKAHSAYTSFANMEVCFVNDKIVETLQDISRTVLEGPDYVILGLQQNKVAVIKNPYAQYQIGLHSSASATLESEYGLSGKQAKATLEISLGRPTALERKKFKLEKLLSSRANIDVIPNDEMLMAICEKGYVKRMKADTFNLQHRGSIGKSVGKLRVDDAMSDFLVCHAHDHVLFFSDRGIVYSTRAYKIPECSRNAAGTPLVQISSMSECERVTSIVPVSEFAEDRYLLMLTMNGCIKKVPLKLFSGIRSTGIIAIRLNSGDELKWVRCCSSDDLVAMASQNGMVVLSTCDGVRTLSRNTKGVTAMRLGKEDKMASMDIIPASLQKDMEEKSEDSSTVKQSTGPWLLFVCENGYGKRVPLSSFKCSRLNRVGLIGSEFAEDDRLAAVFVVGYSLSEDGESDEQVVLVSQSGAVNQIKVRDISIQSRTARGVILMRLDHHAGKIQSACLISAADEEETHK